MLSPDTITLWTALTAFATVTAAIVAAVYTYFTARLLRAQSEPNVIAFVRHDADRPSILVIRADTIPPRTSLEGEIPVMARKHVGRPLKRFSKSHRRWSRSSMATPRARR